MKTQGQIHQYIFNGPTLHDALEAMTRERDNVQKCIDALTRCMDMGLLGPDQKLSARRDGLIAMPTEDHQ